VAGLFEHRIIKVLCVVDYYVYGYTVTTDDVLLEDFFDWRGAHVGEWLHFYPFCKVLHCYYCESVISLRWGPLSNNVDAPPM
jgi:hypothetical protein